ncbi:hypothetical protein PENTCL1PPCAC_15422 [Pristionchus entomophagus]|uniref:G protein-coupled receptor n=1 Tax=Pristionchus entomophagus TaxID=358040 RepID=A0AAV5TE38_9BILA|nr:hypothetical protein PENTCL1PPCAC_15422 [Pristionchus entomophagus]
MAQLQYIFSSHWTLSTLASFLLSRTFHRRQNLYAMQQFFPISTLHAISYAVLFLTVYFSESIKSLMTPGWYLFTSVLASVIPHYCFLCPLMFLILIRRGRFQRAYNVHCMINPEKKPNDIYFTALNEQWQ